MRILSAADQSESSVLLMLTVEEAKELVGMVESLIENTSLNHTHVYDFDAGKEVVLGIYGDRPPELLSARIQRLIDEDV